MTKKKKVKPAKSPASTFHKLSRSSVITANEQKLKFEQQFKKKFEMKPSSNKIAAIKQQKYRSSGNENNSRNKG